MNGRFWERNYAKHEIDEDCIKLFCDENLAGEAE